MCLATGLPMLTVPACLAWHSGSHWCFQFLSIILDGFCEFPTWMTMQMKWRARADTWANVAYHTSWNTCAAQEKKWRVRCAIYTPSVTVDCNNCTPVVVLSEVKLILAHGRRAGKVSSTMLPFNTTPYQHAQTRTCQAQYQTLALGKTYLQQHRACWTTRQDSTCTRWMNAPTAED